MTSRAGTSRDTYTDNLNGVIEEKEEELDGTSQTRDDHYMSYVGSRTSSAYLQKVPSFAQDLPGVSSPVLITQKAGDDCVSFSDDSSIAGFGSEEESESEYDGLSDDLIMPVDIDRDEDYDTDLEIDESALQRENTEFDATGKVDYLRECERLGVTAVTYFERHISNANFVMKYHGLGPVGAKALAKPLEINMMIETLDLEGNHMEDEGACRIANVLKDNLCVKKLVLADNVLHTKGAQAICEMMSENSIITELDLSKNQFKDSDGEYFCQMLQKNTTLKALTLKHNGFEEETAKCLYEALSNNESLKVLDLSWNHFRCKGAEYIGNVIRDNYGLTHINLSMNGLTDDGAKWLGLALKQNQCLTELNISDNRISKEGALHVSRGLETNEVLSVLRIGQNPIGVEGALALLNAIHKNHESTAMVVLDMINVIVNESFEQLHIHVNSNRAKPLLVIHGGVFFRGKHIILLKHTHPELDVGLNPMAKLKKYANYSKLRLVDIFKRFDRDGNWKLSREEFRRGIDITGIDLDEDELTKLMTRLDTNRDGMVDFGELLRGDNEFRRSMRITNERKNSRRESRDSARLVTLKL